MRSSLIAEILRMVADRFDPPDNWGEWLLCQSCNGVLPHHHSECPYADLGVDCPRYDSKELPRYL